jgi:hypothetical protein
MIGLFTYDRRRTAHLQGLSKISLGMRRALNWYESRCRHRPPLPDRSKQRLSATQDRRTLYQRGADRHMDLFGWNVQFDTRDGPKGCKSKNMLEEFFAKDCWGFLSSAIVPSPTIIPDEPLNLPQIMPLADNKIIRPVYNRFRLWLFSGLRE